MEKRLQLFIGIKIIDHIIQVLVILHFWNMD